MPLRETMGGDSCPAMSGERGEASILASRFSPQQGERRSNPSWGGRKRAGIAADTVGKKLCWTLQRGTVQYPGFMNSNLKTTTLWAASWRFTAFTYFYGSGAGVGG